MNNANAVTSRLMSGFRSGPLRFGLICLPTCVTTLLVELSHRGIGFVPIPFLLLLVAVGFAGYSGGRLAGAVSGAIAAVLVLHGHLAGFGPETLTGQWAYTLAGMALYPFVGFILGRLRDQRDAHYEALLKSQYKEQEEPLLLASQLVKLGYYIWDTVADKPIVVSEQHLKNYGTTREEFLAKVSDVGGEFLLVHPDDREKVERWCRRLKDGEMVEMEYRILSDAGTKWMRAIVRPIRDDTGRVVKQVCASLDITAHKATERHLAEAMKLDSVGQLTAGIAHDFNNLLAVILGNLELMIELGANDELAELIDAAVRATMRGSDLTQKLLAFGRKAELNPEIVDTNVIIRDLGEVFRRTLPATIEVETVLAGGLWAVEVDRPQFENALLNLVINARDAMPDGGALTIESANVRLDEAYCDGRGAEIEPGRFVMIAVSDTGTGISESDLKRAFEPFFTTKEVGKGTGLGLALVHGFVKQSGGSVQVYSEIGEGTTVKMYFPAKGKLARTSAQRVDQLPRDVPASGRVLVVDDDADVRQVVIRQMHTLGFDVLDAPDGSAALALLRGDPSIRLLLTDVVMPGPVQGTDLAEIASVEFPKLKIILMTGYAKSAVENGRRKSNGYVKLTKPVQLNELVRVVSRVLDDP